MNDATPVATEPETNRAIFHCLNCGMENTGRFCSECGQEHGPSIAPIGHMVGEIAEEVLKWDTKLWVTIKGLFRPGFLTTEYLAGRRVRYISPLRLFVWTSFLYTILLTLFVGQAKNLSFAESLARATTTVVSTDAAPAGGSAAGASVMAVPETEEQQGHRKRAEAKHIVISRAQESQQGIPPGTPSGLKEDYHLLARLQNLVPWLDVNLSTISILLLPLYALILHLLYRKTQPLYAGQFITVLHAQAAILLFTAPFLIVPALGPLTILSKLIQPLYFYFCLRRVYGDLPDETAGRTAWKVALYFALSFLPIKMLGMMLG